jgi:hypothetical protein
MAISTCSVSGTITGLNGAAIEDAEVFAYMSTPIVIGTDFVPASTTMTTTDSSGDFTIVVPQTTSISSTVTFRIVYPDGVQCAKDAVFEATIPDTATANFEDLITTP